MTPPPPPSPEALWVDTPEALGRLAAELDPALPIAIDTEADSLHHYRESLCLVQIAQNGRYYLADPLAQLDLAPLWGSLAGRPWIIQGADYDLRMIRRGGGPEPSEVFDTMLAGQLLGFPAFGYAAMVERFYGARLCKKNQKADWSRRPLPRSMLSYAVEDTRYLEALARDLAAQLAEKGRLEWHRESCQRVLELSRVSRADDADDPWRIRGANNLHPGALAILRSVWEWREQEAELADVPVFKILSNDQLLSLSAWADRHRHLPPPAWSDWPHRISERRMHALFAALEKGRAAPPESRIARGQRPPPDPQADRRMEKLKAHRDQLAKELALDPGLIASRILLLALARQPAEAPAQLLADRRVCRWQLDLLRPALESIG